MSSPDMNKVQEVFQSYLPRLSQVRHLPPLWGVWEEDRWTIEIQGQDYVFGSIDSGRRTIIARSPDAEEIAYCAFDYETFAIAYRLCAHKMSVAKDYRLFYFPKQVELMAEVSETWAKRLFLRQAKDLSL
jgi:hypothetical protein